MERAFCWLGKPYSISPERGMRPSLPGNTKAYAEFIRGAFAHAYSQAQ